MVFDRRGLFTREQEDFRLLVREFIEREVLPNFTEWEKLGHIPREFFRKLGGIGVMGMAIPEKFGGSGDPDYRYNVILQEEASRALVTLGTTRSQLDVWLPYFLEYSTPEQQERWFPGMAAGELLTAVAMTEPGTGSDLAGIRTRAVHDSDGYILNGTKTFITGGFLADLVIVVARTCDAPPENRRPGLSLLVVEDRRARRRPAEPGRRGHGEAVRHRDAGPRRRPVPAGLRGLRLHHRVPDRPAVGGRAGDQDLRRHQRGHEADHQQVDGTVGLPGTSRPRCLQVLTRC